MGIDVFCVQIALALLLFLTLNWIGRHSAFTGYTTLNAFIQRDGAPFFNLLFRILGPVVFIVLAASLLYAIGFDRYVNKIWLVILYYYISRFLFVLGFSRLSLVNWGRELFQWIASTGLGLLVYVSIVKYKSNLLPEPNELKNQFWILLMMFLYASLNNIRLDQGSTVKRKTNYLRKIYLDNKNHYEIIISSSATDPLSESIIYSILIYEQFNRPKLIRILEHIVYPWGSKSLGPMQVTVNHRVSDNESVQLGIERIMTLYKDALLSGQQKALLKNKSFDPLNNPSHLNYVVYIVASGYNKDDNYLSGIREMHSMVIEYLYPNLKFKQTHWSEYLI
jgi:hypothetical protein